MSKDEEFYKTLTADGIDEQGKMWYISKEVIDMDLEDGGKHFEVNEAIAQMIINGTVFVGSNWFEKEWPEQAKKQAVLNVNCNDLFAWACADAEPLNFEDIYDVYMAFIDENPHAVDMWCCIQRNEMPQDAVLKYWRDYGIDVKLFQEEHGLRSSYYSGVGGVVADQKRDVYTNWCIENHEEPMPYDADWWSGWQEYTDAVPDWCSEEYKDEKQRRINAWREENGH